MSSADATTDREPRRPGVDELRPHEHDGIQEYDNRLPNWWLWTFYGAIIFSVLYWLHFHVLHVGKLPEERYLAEVAAEKARQEASLAGKPLSDDTLWEMSKDPQAVAAGRQVFVQICASCHSTPQGLASGNPDAGGNVGPNLTDKYWLHGNKPTDIYNIVTKGSPNGQMPPWGPMLGPVKTRQVVAYVLTLRNTNHPGGKAPQGKPMD